jgi:hypothetical protein
MNETHILIRLLRMYVYSTELGIRLSFGKTSEFRGGFEPPLGTPLISIPPNSWRTCHYIPSVSQPICLFVPPALFLTAYGRLSCTAHSCHLWGSRWSYLRFIILVPETAAVQSVFTYLLSFSHAIHLRLFQTSHTQNEHYHCLLSIPDVHRPSQACYVSISMCLSTFSWSTYIPSTFLMCVTLILKPRCIHLNVI